MKKHSNRKSKRQRGFTLIEVLIAAAVVVILSSALAIVGARAIRSGNETSALSSLKGVADSETSYQHAWGGYSALAAYLGGSDKPGDTVTVIEDKEMPQTIATAMDTPGYVASGYTILYKAIGVAFGANGGGAVNVSPDFEAVANPTSKGSGARIFCQDSGGTYWLPYTGTPITPVNGCVADTINNPLGK